MFGINWSRMLVTKPLRRSTHWAAKPYRSAKAKKRTRRSR